MAININGTSGISGVDGTAGTPALQGSDTNTGISFGADTVNINTGGTTRATVDSSGRLGIGTTSPQALLDLSANSETGSNTLRFTDSDTLTVANQQIGKIEFYSADASTPGAGVKAYIGAFAEDTSPDAYLAFATDATTGTPTERARITSSGQLLVGTSTSPSAGQGQFSLAVVQGYSGGSIGAGDFSLQRGQAATSMGSGDDIGYVKFNDNAGNTFASIAALVDATPGASDFPGRLVFSTTADGASSPTEAMRINSSQNLLVGGTDTGGKVTITRSGIVLRLNTASTSNTAVQFVYNGSTQVGTITTTTTATAYNTSSDYRLKENVTPVTDGITRLQQLKPSRFNFIADPTKTVDGFLAHEVQTIVPEAITGEKDAVDEDGNPEYQGIDQSKLVPLLTAALQEAIAKIETLETRLTALEGGAAQ